MPAAYSPRAACPRARTDTWPVLSYTSGGSEPMHLLPTPAPAGSKARQCWLLAAAVVLSASALAQQALTPPQGEGWELSSTHDGVDLYEREVSGSSLREAYCRTLVEQPPYRVWKVLRDYETFPEWAPYSQETRLLSSEPGAEY